MKWTENKQWKGIGRFTKWPYFKRKEESCASKHFTLSLSFIIIGLICAFEYIVMNKNNIRPYALYKRRQLHQVPIASNEKDTAFDLHNLAESNIYPKLPLTSSVSV